MTSQLCDVWIEGREVDKIESGECLNEEIGRLGNQNQSTASSSDRPCACFTFNSPKTDRKSIEHLL